MRDEYIKENVYDLDICMREDEHVKENDVVHITTSEFRYNSLTGCFDNEALKTVRVRAEHIGEDYSEYRAGKSRNGGCYGYDSYRVLEVLS